MQFCWEISWSDVLFILEAKSERCLWFSFSQTFLFAFFFSTLLFSSKYFHTFILPDSWMFPLSILSLSTIIGIMMLHSYRSEWSPCTSSCGQGIKARTRLYINPGVSNVCDVKLIEKSPCFGERSGSSECPSGNSNGGYYGGVGSNNYVNNSIPSFPPREGEWTHYYLHLLPRKRSSSAIMTQRDSHLPCSSSCFLTRTETVQSSCFSLSFPLFSWHADDALLMQT